MWFNFAHLFSVSLLPLSTAWMAVSRLAPQPVAFYAAVFFLVNATYISLIWELIERTPVKEVSPKERKICASVRLSLYVFSQRPRLLRWNIHCLDLECVVAAYSFT
jgi:uncharacterized membrane protein